MPNSDSEKHNDADEVYDIFRESPLRYLGYANEVGESFRYQFPKLVIPSYVVAFGYCLADAATSGHSAYEESVKKESPTAMVDAVVPTLDCLIWQSLASVTIPGATINAVVRASRFAVARSPAAVPAAVVTWAPTVIGLCSVPVIIHPIDQGVDYLMDSTYRQINFPSLFSTSTNDGEEDSSK